MKRKTVDKNDVETVTLSSSSESESSLDDKSELEMNGTNTPSTSIVDTKTTSTLDFVDENVILVPNNDETVLLILSAKKSIYFKGKLSVEVLSGSLGVLGSTIRPTDGPKDVFSPRGYSLLYMSAKQDEPTESSTNFVERLTQLGVKSSELRSRLTEAAEGGSTIVALSKIVDTSDFVSKYLSHSLGGKVTLFGRDSGLLDRHSSTVSSNLAEAEKRLNINFFTQDQNQVLKARLYQPNPEWEKAIQSVKFAVEDNVQPRLLVAGGKGVGKSTFVRFLVNRLLAELGGPVLVVDLDPGQAEFSVPGCLSCVKINDPILGPNFTHVSMQKEICLFLGTVDVSSAQVRFEKCLDELKKKSSEYSDIPWVINTMGFTEGLGIHLMKKSVEMFRPTTIVEIESRSYKKNFKSKTFFPNLVTLNKLSCNVLRFLAMPESVDARDFGVQDGWGIPQASKLRDIVMLSFIEASFPNLSSLQSIVPRAVGWSEIFVQLLNVRESFSVQNMVKTLNTGFISLGHLASGENIPALKPDALNVLRNPHILVPSIGFGIIRSIDVERKLFYIITNLDDQALENVNCITMGPTVRLPNGILANQHSQKSTLPYLSKANSKCLLSTPWQRHNKPRPDD